MCGTAFRIPALDVRPVAVLTPKAEVYVFLASAESSYVLGKTLNVNGAMPTP